MMAFNDYIFRESDKETIENSLERWRVFYRGKPISHYEIEKVAFNSPATIVWFADGEKVIVKTNNEEFDEEKGLAMAVMRKLYGRAEFNRVLESAVRQGKVVPKKKDKIVSKFELGKKYIFSKNQMKMVGDYDPECDSWIEDCEGKLVKLRISKTTNKIYGDIEGYGIDSRWCLEVK